MAITITVQPATGDGNTIYTVAGFTGGPLNVSKSNLQQDMILLSVALNSAGTPGAGTVTSVGLALPNIFNVTGSPVTGTGTLIGTLAAQAANSFFAGPTSSTATPTFRAIVPGDVPTLNQNTTGSAGSVALGGITGLGAGVAAAAGNASNTSNGFLTLGFADARYDVIGAATSLLGSNNTWAGTQLFNGNVTFGSSTTISGTIQQRNGSGPYGSILLAGEGYFDTTGENYYQGDGSTTGGTLIGGPGFYRGVSIGVSGTGAAGTPGTAGSITGANLITITSGNGGNTVTVGSVGGNGGDVTGGLASITGGNGGSVASGGTGTGGNGSKLTGSVIKVSAATGGAAIATSTTGTGGNSSTLSGSLISIVPGIGKASGTTGNGGNAGSNGGIPLITFSFGNGGNADGTVSAPNGGGILTGSPITIQSGSAGNIGAGSSGTAGGGGGLNIALNATAGNGGSSAAGSSGNGGAGGATGSFNANGGNGSSGSGATNGAAGGVAGTADISGGNASGATVGGAGGTLNVKGVGTVAGGKLILSNSVNTITTSGASPVVVTIPNIAALTLDDRALMTANTTAAVTFNNIGQNETQYNIGTAQATATITLPTTSTVGQIVRYITGVISVITMAGGTLILGAGIGTTAANGSYAWQCSTSGNWIRIQ